MTTNRIERVLIAGLAVLSIVLVASMALLPMATPVGDYTHPVTMDADDWATWMDARMTEHMGPGSVAWMESHMGVTVEQMGQYMTRMGQYMTRNGAPSGRMYSPGHGC